MKRLKAMPSHLREPIAIPRWVLLLKYVFFVILALTTVIRGSATLDLTQPASYTPIWSMAVGAGALLAFFGCAFVRLAPIEKWAAAWLSCWLAVLAVNAAFIANGSGWLIVIFITLLPMGRAISLFSKRAA